jgi:hypothetical protein
VKSQTGNREATGANPGCVGLTQLFRDMDVRAEGVAQWSEHLPSMCEALGSILSAVKKKNSEIYNFLF